MKNLPIGNEQVRQMTFFHDQDGLASAPSASRAPAAALPLALLPDDQRDRVSEHAEEEKQEDHKDQRERRAGGPGI